MTIVMAATTDMWAPSPPVASGTLSVKGASTSNRNLAFYSLTRPRALKEEDDWTKVKDPKQKKRIQNRVAQRTYRHRMKAKLDELQARLETHEGSRTHISASVNALPPPSMPPSAPFTSDESLLHDAACSTMATMGMEEKERHPLSSSMEPQALPQAYSYEQSIGDIVSASFQTLSRDTMMESSPPQRSPPPHGLLSPPQSNKQPTRDPQPDQQPNFMLECLNFQSQLMERLKQLQKETGFPAPHNGGLSYDNIGAKNSTMFSPDHGDFPLTCDMWNYETDSGGEETVSMPPRGASLEDRLDYIVTHAETAGFESFDAVVAAYYAHKFRATPPLSDEQQVR